MRNPSSLHAAALAFALAVPASAAEPTAQTLPPIPAAQTPTETPTPSAQNPAPSSPAASATPTPSDQPAPTPTTDYWTGYAKGPWFAITVGDGKSEYWYNAQDADKTNASVSSGWRDSGTFPLYNLKKKSSSASDANTVTSVYSSRRTSYRLVVDAGGAKVVNAADTKYAGVPHRVDFWDVPHPTMIVDKPTTAPEPAPHHGRTHKPGSSTTPPDDSGANAPLLPLKASDLVKLSPQDRQAYLDAWSATTDEDAHRALNKKYSDMIAAANPAGTPPATTPSDAPPNTPPVPPSSGSSSPSPSAPPSAPTGPQSIDDVIRSLLTGKDLTAFNGDLANASTEDAKNAVRDRALAQVAPSLTYDVLKNMPYTPRESICDRVKVNSKASAGGASQVDRKTIDHAKRIDAGTVGFDSANGPSAPTTIANPTEIGSPLSQSPALKTLLSSCLNIEGTQTQTGGGSQNAAGADNPPPSPCGATAKASANPSAQSGTDKVTPCPGNDSPDKNFQTNISFGLATGIGGLILGSFLGGPLIMLLCAVAAGGAGYAISKGITDPPKDDDKKGGS